MIQDYYLSHLRFSWTRGGAPSGPRGATPTRTTPSWRRRPRRRERLAKVRLLTRRLPNKLSKKFWETAAGDFLQSWCLCKSPIKTPLLCPIKLPKTPVGDFTKTPAGALWRHKLYRKASRSDSQIESTQSDWLNGQSYNWISWTMTIAGASRTSLGSQKASVKKSSPSAAKRWRGRRCCRYFGIHSILVITWELSAMSGQGDPFCRRVDFVECGLGVPPPSGCCANYALFETYQAL